MDFDACIPAVAGGKVDIVAAGLSVDPERAEQVDFSTNYVDSTEVVVVNAAAPAVTEATGEALAGKVEYSRATLRTSGCPMRTIRFPAK